jgi:membrane protein implicated in regulation of membrane protease activity
MKEKAMNQHNTLQFFRLYHRYRYEHQINYYSNRQKELTRAQNQAIWLSIGLIFLAALAAALETVSVPWFKYICLFLAVICPVLSSALAGYNALYAFEKQAKIYRDARQNLEMLDARWPDLQQAQKEEEIVKQVNDYIQETEAILRTERGYWGQLAKSMRPLDV